MCDDCKNERDRDRDRESEILDREGGIEKKIWQKERIGRERETDRQRERDRERDRESEILDREGGIEKKISHGKRREIVEREREIDR